MTGKNQEGHAEAEKKNSRWQEKMSFKKLQNSFGIRPDQTRLHS